MNPEDAADAGRLKLSVAVMAALAVGLALRLWFVFHYAVVNGDTLFYGDFAKNMLEHHAYGFSDTPHGVLEVRSTLIRLPGYPLFLAVCFRLFGMEHYTAVMLAQTAIDLWTCLLVGGVAARVFGARAGVAAVWMAAICPFTANYVAAPLTETLTLFCIGLAFYGLVRWRDVVVGEGRHIPGAKAQILSRSAMSGLKPGPVSGAKTEVVAGDEAVASPPQAMKLPEMGHPENYINRWLFCVGFALAYAILLRPEQGLLAAAVVPAMAWIAWREGGSWVRPVALVCVLAVLPLGPWAVRNWMTFHVFQPLAPKYAVDPGESNPYGFQRWYRTWAVDFASTDEVYWNYDGAPVSIADLPNRAFDSNAEYAATEALLAEYNETNKPSASLDARWNALAAERIHADPLRYYVELPVARVVDMMFRPRTEPLPLPLEWWKRSEGVGAWWMQIGFVTLNAGYFALAWVGFRRVGLWQTQRVVVWAMVATLLLRTLLLLTLDNSEPRYTLEFFPVLVVLGSSVWARLRRDPLIAMKLR